MENNSKLRSPRKNPTPRKVLRVNLEPPHLSNVGQDINNVSTINGTATNVTSSARMECDSVNTPLRDEQIKCPSSSYRTTASDLHCASASIVSDVSRKGENLKRKHTKRLTNPAVKRRKCYADIDSSLFSSKGKSSNRAATVKDCFKEHQHTTQQNLKQQHSSSRQLRCRKSKSRDISVEKTITSADVESCSSPLYQDINKSDKISCVLLRVGETASAGNHLKQKGVCKRLFDVAANVGESVTTEPDQILLCRNKCAAGNDDVNLSLKDTEESSRPMDFFTSPFNISMTVTASSTPAVEMNFGFKNPVSFPLNLSTIESNKNSCDSEQSEVKDDMQNSLSVSELQSEQSFRCSDETLVSSINDRCDGLLSADKAMATGETSLIDDSLCSSKVKQPIDAVMTPCHKAETVNNLPVNECTVSFGSNYSFQQSSAFQDSFEVLPDGNVPVTPDGIQQVTDELRVLNQRSSHITTDIYRRQTPRRKRNYGGSLRMGYDFLPQNSLTKFTPPRKCFGKTPSKTSPQVTPKRPFAKTVLPFSARTILGSPVLRAMKSSSIGVLPLDLKTPSKTNTKRKLYMDPVAMVTESEKPSIQVERVSDPQEEMALTFPKSDIVPSETSRKGECELSSLTCRSPQTPDVQSQLTIVENSEIEDELDIDKILEEKSKKFPLTAKNVRSFLNLVISDESVKLLVRNALTEDSLREQLEEAMFEPKMTRRRLKEVMEQGKIPPPFAISPLRTGKKKTFLELNFPEEEDDEEYQPSREELEHISDDDESIHSSHASDFGSPNVNLLTPKCKLSSNHPAVEGDKTPVITSMGPPADLPVRKQCNQSNNYGKDDESQIALRTRSKLPLNDTPLNEIEASLDHADPDCTPDLADGMMDFDPDYNYFLAELIHGPFAEDPDDDANDPEFNMVLEQEFMEDDPEERRNDKAVRISKKEVKDLMEQWNNSFIPDFDEYSLDNYFNTENESRPSDSVVSGAVSSEANSANPNADGDIILSATAEQYFEDDKSRSAAAPKYSDRIPPLRMDPSLVGMLVSDLKNSNNELTSDQAKNYTKFTEDEHIQLRDQMRKHVQLLAQTYVQSWPFSCSDMQAAAEFAAESLALLKNLAEKSSVPYQQSYYYATNLEGAIEITLHSFEGKDEELAKIVARAMTERVMCKRMYDLRGLTYEQMETFATSRAFVFPQMLPDHRMVPFEELEKKIRVNFSPAEDNLLAMGVDQFGHLETTKYSLIRQYLLPTKTNNQLRFRYKNLKTKNSPQDNPVKFLAAHGCLPNFRRYIDLENETCIVPPIERDPDLLPKWFIAFEESRRLYAKRLELQPWSICGVPGSFLKEHGNRFNLKTQQNRRSAAVKQIPILPRIQTQAGTQLVLVDPSMSSARPLMALTSDQGSSAGFQLGSNVVTMSPDSLYKIVSTISSMQPATNNSVQMPIAPTQMNLGMNNTGLVPVELNNTGDLSIGFASSLQQPSFVPYSTPPVSMLPSSYSDFISSSSMLSSSSATMIDLMAGMSTNSQPDSQLIAEQDFERNLFCGYQEFPVTSSMLLENPVVSGVASSQYTLTNMFPTQTSTFTQAPSFSNPEAFASASFLSTECSGGGIVTSSEAIVSNCNQLVPENATVIVTVDKHSSSTQTCPSIVLSPTKIIPSLPHIPEPVLMFTQGQLRQLGLNVNVISQNTLLNAERNTNLLQAICSSPGAQKEPRFDKGLSNPGVEAIPSPTIGNDNSQAEDFNSDIIRCAFASAMGVSVSQVMETKMYGEESLLSNNDAEFLGSIEPTDSKHQTIQAVSESEFSCSDTEAPIAQTIGEITLKVDNSGAEAWIESADVKIETNIQEVEADLNDQVEMEIGDCDNVSAKLLKGNDVICIEKALLEAPQATNLSSNQSGEINTCAADQSYFEINCSMDLDILRTNHTLSPRSTVVNDSQLDGNVSMLCTPRKYSNLSPPCISKPPSVISESTSNDQSHPEFPIVTSTFSSPISSEKCQSYFSPPATSFGSSLRAKRKIQQGQRSPVRFILPNPSPPSSSISSSRVSPFLTKPLFPKKNRSSQRTLQLIAPKIQSTGNAQTKSSVASLRQKSRCKRSRLQQQKSGDNSASMRPILPKSDVMLMGQLNTGQESWNPDFKQYKKSGRDECADIGMVNDSDSGSRQKAEDRCGKSQMRLDSEAEGEEDIPDASGTGCDFDSQTEEDNDMEMHLAELLQASTTIRTCQKGSRSQVEKINKAERKRELALAMLSPDILANDQLRDERDAMFAHSYQSRVRKTLENNLGLYEKYLRLLAEFDEKCKTISELYQELKILFSSYPYLITEFAGFLLPEQSIESSCFLSNYDFTRARTFMCKLEMYLHKHPSHLQKFHKAFRQWNESKLSDDEVYNFVLPLIRGSQHLVDEFTMFFDEKKPPTNRFTQYEEVILGNSDDSHDYDEYEKVEIPNQEENYGSSHCPCRCHMNGAECFVKKLRHCISCGLKVIKGQLYLQTSDKFLRPATVTYYPQKPKQDEFNENSSSHFKTYKGKVIKQKKMSRNKLCRPHVRKKSPASSSVTAIADITTIELSTSSNLAADLPGNCISSTDPKQTSVTSTMKHLKSPTRVIDSSEVSMSSNLAADLPENCISSTGPNLTSVTSASKHLKSPTGISDASSELMDVPSNSVLFSESPGRNMLIDDRVISKALTDNDGSPNTASTIDNVEFSMNIDKILSDIKMPKSSEGVLSDAAGQRDQKTTANRELLADNPAMEAVDLLFSDTSILIESEGIERTTATSHFCSAHELDVVESDAMDAESDLRSDKHLMVSDVHGVTEPFLPELEHSDKHLISKTGQMSASKDVLLCVTKDNVAHIDKKIPSRVHQIDVSLDGLRDILTDSCSGNFCDRNLLSLESEHGVPFAVNNSSEAPGHVLLSGTGTLSDGNTGGDDDDGDKSSHKTTDERNSSAELSPTPKNSADWSREEDTVILTICKNHGISEATCEAVVQTLAYRTKQEVSERLDFLLKKYFEMNDLSDASDTDESDIELE